MKNQKWKNKYMFLYLSSFKGKKFKALFESMKNKFCFRSSAHETIYIYINKYISQKPMPTDSKA